MRSLKNITIEGRNQNCIVCIDSQVDFVDIIEQLSSLFLENKEFFNGSSLVIDLKERRLKEKECRDLVHLFHEFFKVKISSVICHNPLTKNALQQLGITIADDELRNKTETTKPKRRDTSIFSKSRAHGSSIKSMLLNSKLIYATLRSGQIMESKGSLIIVGDVNPGAEVRAEDDIIVLGSLRGMAHAGVSGNVKARIIALHLCPTLLKIGDCIAGAPPDMETKKSFKPEVAFIENKKIIIENLIM
jgi:septum site-determining protein MinC